MKTKITQVLLVFLLFTIAASAQTSSANNPSYASDADASGERSATLKVHFKELTAADVTAIGQRFQLHGLNDVSIVSSDVAQRIIEIQFSGKPEEQRKIQQIFIDGGLKFFYAP